ncbi:hypothetical protein M9Y10_022384 [Tritrichomonas musculus]|uniref:TAFII28-like protein domain-containing protein n=1 Tax=Tritrichomonas musculus TaxID=1915356 RepID=A0ABR2KS44_9EUKA
MSDSDDDLSPQQIQKRKTEQMISNLSIEQKQRLDFFRSQQCKFSTSKVQEIMKEELPPGVSIKKDAVSAASRAAKLFIAELIETAKKFSTENNPITPDLIYIAYSDLSKQRKVPGIISGLPVPDKRL